MEARLGHPERYAADLRAAAGLKRQRGPIAFVRAQRPRTFVLTAVALAVIGLGVAGFVWVYSYQPIALGAGRYPQGAKPVTFPGFKGMDVDFREGKPFAFGLSVVNSGHFTVRVTGFEPWGVLPVRARPYVAGRLFHPFDLAPGKTAVVELRGVYHARCHPMHGAGTAWGNGGFEVRYSFLWRTGTAEVALPGPLLIDPPDGVACRPTP